jgi:hypothetical protein
MNGKSPHLKGFSCNPLVIGLNDGDLVKQLIGPGGVGNILCPISEYYGSINTMPIPLFRAGCARGKPPRSGGYGTDVDHFQSRMIAERLFNPADT